MSDSSPSPAWYPDPENPAQLRWWSGAEWTPHTAPAGAAAPLPPAATSRPAPRLRWWMIALMLLGVLLLGSLLARLSPFLFGLALLGTLGIGLYALIRGGAPRLLLRSRGSSLIALGAALLLVIGGSAASGATRPASETNAVSASETPRALAASPPTPTPTPTTFEKVDVTTTIPFERSTVDDAARDLGTTTVVTAGVNGTKVITYRVTKVNGTETARVVIGESVTVAPVTEVTAHGTRVAPAAPAPEPAPFVAPPAENACDPNYTGACVPIASDVDCAGGSGNGPAYVQGPVRVVGTDIYKLDSNGDGIGCEG